MTSKPLMDVPGWEAFVHGVYAIAVTLLVLDIKVPDVASVGSGTALIGYSNMPRSGRMLTVSGVSCSRAGSSSLLPDGALEGCCSAIKFASFTISAACSRLAMRSFSSVDIV